MGKNLKNPTHDLLCNNQMQKKRQEVLDRRDVLYMLYDRKIILSFMVWYEKGHDVFERLLCLKCIKSMLAERLLISLSNIFRELED